MGDWEDLTEMFGLDASASWDAVAARMGVDDDERVDEEDLWVRRRSRSFVPLQSVEDERAGAARQSILNAIHAAGCAGPFRLMIDDGVFVLDFGDYVARIFPPTTHHGWSFTSRWRVFTEEDEKNHLLSRCWQGPFHPSDRFEIDIERGLRAAMQLQFGRPGACELNVWKPADYTDIEKAMRVWIEFDHLPGMSIVHAGRGSSELGRLLLTRGEPTRTALIRVRHGHDASWVEGAEGDIDVLSVLLPAIRARSIVRPEVKATPVEQPPAVEDRSHDAE